MATKEIRLKARRDARDQLARKRKERAELDSKRDALAVRVMAALAERDALVADAERCAGTALSELIATGLSLAQAAIWCDGITLKEAARLNALAAQPSAPTTRPPEATARASTTPKPDAKEVATHVDDR